MKIIPSQPINLNNNSMNVAPISEGASFADFLNNAVSDVNKLQVDSERLNEALAIGKTDNIHQVMIAAEKAEIALQFTMQIRNKILDAYQEIMRMPI
ncbi:MAG: flagellar hook-basal body complex protein FliE [Clostridia bacterium]